MKGEGERKEGLSILLNTTLSLVSLVLIQLKDMPNIFENVQGLLKIKIIVPNKRRVSSNLNQRVSCEVSLEFS